MKSVKISVLSFTFLSLIMIPWTKQEFRIGPIPAAYVPIIVVMFLAMFRTSLQTFSNFKIDKSGAALSNWLLILISFILISAVFSIDKLSAMVYTMQWFFYILIMIYISNIQAERKTLEKSLVTIITFISAGCIMGLIRFFFFFFIPMPTRY